MNINTRNSVSFDEVDGNRFLSAAFKDSINVTAGSFSVKNGAQLVTNTRGQGDAGNIEVSVRSIGLENKAFLSSDTIAEQGNTNLRSGEVLRRGSNITTNATGKPEDGNITIDAGVIAALESRDISANAQNARGGKSHNRRPRYFWYRIP